MIKSVFFLAAPAPPKNLHLSEHSLHMKEYARNRSPLIISVYLAEMVADLPKWWLIDLP